jgi:hypothetical protein
MNRLLVLLALAVTSTEPLPERVFDGLHEYGKAREPNGPIAETMTERDARYHDIAVGIDAACTRHPWPGWPHVACVALATTAAKWESGLLKTVHEGTLLGKAGERCLFQLHRKVSLVPSAKWRVTPEEWAATTGLGAEATARCADAGVRVLGWQIARCGIKYEQGGRYVASQVFAEYHMPSADCRTVISRMSDTRAGSYQAELMRLR